MKKKLLSSFLAVLFVFSAFSVAGLTVSAEAITPTPDWYGDGTATSYTINNAADLMAFATALNSGTTFEGKVITLTDDVDLNPGFTGKFKSGTLGSKNMVAPDAPTNVWPVKGSSGPTQQFKGTFDGNWHTISGVYQVDTNKNLGIFGNSYGSTVKNLKIDNSYVAGSGTYVGAIFGSTLSGVTKLENLYVDVTVNDTKGGTTATNTRVGGLVGAANASVQIENTVFTGYVFSKVGMRIGGMIGWMINNDVSITNSAFFGTVEGYQTVVSAFVGGIGNNGTPAANYYLTIENSIAAGTVYSKSASYSGMFCAQISSTATKAFVTINNSYYTILIRDAGELLNTKDWPLPVNEGGNTVTATEGSTYYRIGDPGEGASNDFAAAVARVNTQNTILKNYKTQSYMEERNMTGWSATIDGYVLPKPLLHFTEGFNDIETDAVTKSIGYQKTAVADGVCDIRLLGVFVPTSLDGYENVGMKVVATYIDAAGNAYKAQSKDFTTTTVYTSVHGTNAQGEAEEYTAGDAGTYMYAIKCKNVKADAGSIVFQIITYHTPTDGEAIQDSSCRFTVNFD